MSKLSANQITDLTGKTILNNTGGILQVVQSTGGGSVSTTSGSYVSTGLNCSITPSSSTSKILVLASGYAQNVAGNGTYYSINRGSTQIQSILIQYANNNTNNICAICENILDSPATTSQIIYNTNFAIYGGSISTVGNLVLILMEVSG